MSRHVDVEESQIGPWFQRERERERGTSKTQACRRTLTILSLFVKSGGCILAYSGADLEMNWVHAHRKFSFDSESKRWTTDRPLTFHIPRPCIQ